MTNLSQFAFWRDVVAGAYGETGAMVASFLPKLGAALLVLIAGWITARVAELVVRRLLRAAGVDRAANRLRLAERAGMQASLSEAAGRLLFWLLMIVFLLASVRLLGLVAVTAAIERITAYLPNLIGATLIAFVGLLLARFLGGVARSSALAAGFPSGARLGVLVHAFAAGVVVILAFEQLGFSTQILVLPVTALAAAIGLSAGLAVALGAHPIITHILAGHFLRESLPRDRFVEVNGQRGIVERVGAVDTLFRDGEKRWSVPNAQLINHVVVQ